MTYSPNLASAFNDTRMRSDKTTPCSGMCSLCNVLHHLGLLLHAGR